MEWTDEQSLSFIDMYRARPILWDSFNQEYKNRNRRHDLLCEIADCFGVDKQQVERKIKNLQSHFVRERKKELDSKKTGSGADQPYVSRWFAYHAMMFLADRNKPRNTVDNVENSRIQKGTEKDGREELSENEENKEKEDQALQNSSINQENNLATTTPKHTRNKEFKSPKNLSSMNAKHSFNSSAIKGAPILEEAVNLMKSIQSKREHTKDEFSLYGEQVAIKLRRLTSSKARFTVQNKINRALYEADIGMYDDNVRIRQQTPTRLIYRSPASSSNVRTSFTPMTHQSQTVFGRSANFEVVESSPICSESTSPETIFSDDIIDYCQEESYDECDPTYPI